MHALGTHGEKLAAQYLKKKGYIVVETNFTTPLGEIDIICKHKGTLVFVEVKTRTSNYMAEPYMAVNSKKKLHAKRAIDIYVQKKKITDVLLRYDIVSIVVTKANTVIEHIENVELE